MLMVIIEKRHFGGRPCSGIRNMASRRFRFTRSSLSCAFIHHPHYVFILLSPQPSLTFSRSEDHKSRNCRPQRATSPGDWESRAVVHAVAAAAAAGDDEAADSWSGCCSCHLRGSIAAEVAMLTGQPWSQPLMSSNCERRERRTGSYW